MSTDNQEIADSIAAMVSEWVDGGEKLGTDWRLGLADVIQRRLDRLRQPASDTPDLRELTFSMLRTANMRRLPLFKNRRGQPAHSQPDGSDWALSAWCNALTGELGEAANLVKKIERGDMSLDEARTDLAKELGDIQTYLDIFAFRAGVNLGAATIAKFNEVSDRVQCDVKLPTPTADAATHNQALDDAKRAIQALIDGAYENSAHSIDATVTAMTERSAWSAAIAAVDQLRKPETDSSNGRAALPATEEAP